MAQKPILFITPGDPNGIGPEVVWKTLKDRNLRSAYRLVCIGSLEPFKRLKAKISVLSHPDEATSFVGGTIQLLPAPTHGDRANLGGFQSGWSIAEATGYLLKNKVLYRGLVTGPISKENLQAGGYLYNGHTDFLLALCNQALPKKNSSVTMMLANRFLKVSLATVHCSIAQVPILLTKKEIVRCIEHTVNHLLGYCRVSRPKIAVCGLNPHAGESGLFGNEEKKVIIPAIQATQKLFGQRVIIEGPLPADTLFAQTSKKQFDAVVAMYHDQGLIPVKLLDFPNTVNLSLGLPIVRTSVDHGTGFDIAWKNMADPSSFKAALKMAEQLCKSSKTPM